MSTKLILIIKDETGKVFEHWEFAKPNMTERDKTSLEIFIINRVLERINQWMKISTKCIIITGEPPVNP